MNGQRSMEITFAYALEHGLSLAEYPKSDLHSHAGRGGNVKHLSSLTGKIIPSSPLPEKFSSLSHMQQWYSDNILCYASGLRGQLKRWESSFRQASDDTVAVLALSFSPSEIEFAGGMDEFIKIISGMSAAFAPDTVFLPELTYDRACDVNKEVLDIDHILVHGFFKSIDICCNEFAQPVVNFKPLFRKAEKYGLRLKAHTGEFGTADDVMEAVEELELDEVHHGIAAAQSPFVMKWLAENQIQLNICPTSNVMLNVAGDYQSHPIAELYRAGIPLTVNTDDLLIFNQSVSQEYRNLYANGVLSGDELNDIRKQGLRQPGFYND